MGILGKLFGGDAKATARRSTAVARPASPRGPSSSIPPANLRRELLRLVLRQSLARNGIPVHWIGAEAIELPGPGAPVHVRLLVQHWDERLPRYFLAFQEDFEQRLLAVEPLARTWLRGFSWQFQLVDVSSRPALPDVGTWGDPRDTGAAADPQPTPSDRKVREELGRLFAAQDAARARDTHVDFAPTQQGDW
ncbi:MAG: hypothetical protein ACXWC6_14210 [Ramlibacter sp.]